MKRSQLLIVSILFAFSFFAYSPAKTSTAQTTRNSSFLSVPGKWLSGLFGGSSSRNGSTGLPINSNLWFLVVVSAAIGCKVIMNNSKVVQTQRI